MIHFQSPIYYVSPTVCVTVRCLGDIASVLWLPVTMGCHAKSGVPCMTDCDVTIRFACVDVRHDCRALNLW